MRKHFDAQNLWFCFGGLLLSLPGLFAAAWGAFGWALDACVTMLFMLGLKMYGDKVTERGF